MNFILAMILAMLIPLAFRILGWLMRQAMDEIRNGDRKELNEMLLVIACGLLVCGTLMAPGLLGIQIWIKKASQN